MKKLNILAVSLTVVLSAGAKSQGNVGSVLPEKGFTVDTCSYTITIDDSLTLGCAFQITVKQTNDMNGTWTTVRVDQVGPYTYRFCVTDQFFTVGLSTNGCTTFHWSVTGGGLNEHYSIPNDYNYQILNYPNCGGTIVIK